MKVVLIQKQELDARDAVITTEDWYLPAAAVDTGVINEAGFKVFTLFPETKAEVEQVVEEVPTEVTPPADATPLWKKKHRKK